MNTERGGSGCSRRFVQAETLKPTMVIQSPLQYEAHGHLAKSFNRQVENIKAGNHPTVLYQANQASSEASQDQGPSTSSK